MDEMKQEVGQFTRICIPLVKKIYAGSYDIMQRRKLKAVWTMEAEQDLRAWSNDTATDLQKDIQQELDKELIYDLRQAVIVSRCMYKSPSWTKGKLKNEVTIQEE